MGKVTQLVWSAGLATLHPKTKTRVDIASGSLKPMGSSRN